MHGLDKFREYMSGFRSHYVVIGGVATVLTLQDRGLPARATKDVDMIIICQPESKFYMKPWIQDTRKLLSPQKRGGLTHKKNIKKHAYIWPNWTKGLSLRPNNDIL